MFQNSEKWRELLDMCDGKSISIKKIFSDMADVKKIMICRSTIGGYAWMFHETNELILDVNNKEIQDEDFNEYVEKILGCSLSKCSVIYFE